MKLTVAALLIIAAVAPSLGQDEDFHRAKFPDKP
jgi:hypothetical protein